MAGKLFQRFRHRMMRWMVRVMPSCQEISQSISTAMDETLPLRKRLSIRLHLLLCHLCRRYEKQLHLLRGGARHYADPDENAVEDTLSSEARERLRRKLTAHD